MELDFFTATQAHMKWKARLLSSVRGDSQEVLDPAVIALDNRCDLGKWLHAIHSHTHSLPLSPGTHRLFTRLLAEHAQFHRVAAATAQLSLQGDTQQALRQLQGGEYSRISNQVIGSLGELYLQRKEFGME